MNRPERRKAAKQPPKQETVTTQYGHNGQQVLISWNKSIQMLMLTEAEVDSMCDWLHKAKAQMIEHQVKNGTRPS